MPRMNWKEQAEILAVRVNPCGPKDCKTEPCSTGRKVLKVLGYKYVPGTGWRKPSKPQSKRSR